jgi:hypothetical protein
MIPMVRNMSFPVLDLEKTIFTCKQIMEELKQKLYLDNAEYILLPASPDLFKRF